MYVVVQVLEHSRCSLWHNENYVAFKSWYYQIAIIDSVFAKGLKAFTLYRFVNSSKASKALAPYAIDGPPPM